MAYVGFNVHSVGECTKSEKCVGEQGADIKGALACRDGKQGGDGDEDLDGAGGLEELGKA